MQIRIKKRCLIKGKKVTAKTVLTVPQDVDRQTADHLVSIGRAGVVDEQPVVSDETGD